MRPDISVYWSPGCSMCLRTKEFLEGEGIAFESLNVMERTDALAELSVAGIRGMPAIRKGDRFVYVQSVEAIVEFLGLDRRPAGGLTQIQLLDRWQQILGRARIVATSFDEGMLARRAILDRERPVRDLSSHVFQIAEGFLQTLATGVAVTREFQNRPRAEIVTRADLVAFVDHIADRYGAWFGGGGADTIPDRLPTYYGEHPAYAVVERGVWHSAQHARQIDTIAAGVGFEYQIPPELYAGLPMPKRLWA